MPIGLLVAGAWAGCTGSIGDDGKVTDPDALVPPAADMGVGPSGVRRLSVYELDLTLLDLLGDDTRPAITLLPEDARTPFDNDFVTQEPSRVAIDAFETIAISVSTRLLSDAGRRDAVVGCTPQGADDGACMHSFVETFGQRAFRRPLSEGEVDDYLTLGTDWAAQETDFYAGVDVVVRAMLQSGPFLYRVEIGEPVSGQAGLFRLDGYEIASRMSYLIWGSMPDDTLLDEAGSLDDIGSRRDAALRMLQDDRALRQIDRFHAMWLSYDRMPLPVDLTIAMRTETNALIDRVIFDQRGSWLDLFTSQETFVDATLAQHYGLPVPANAAGDWVDGAASGRQGLLSHGSFLSAASNPGDTSPTKRGKLIRNRLLCQTILPPPPEVSVDEPPTPGPDTCKEEAYAQSRASAPNCAGCHEQMDLVGFGLENYDMQGRYRAHDDGKPECTISGQGELSETGQTFVGPAGLSTLLVDSGALADCVVQHLVQYNVGRTLTDDDDALLTRLAASFEETDHRFGELVVAMVSSEAFGFRLEMPTEGN